MESIEQLYTQSEKRKAFYDSVKAKILKINNEAIIEDFIVSEKGSILCAVNYQKCTNNEIFSIPYFETTWIDFGTKTVNYIIQACKAQKFIEF